MHYHTIKYVSYDTKLYQINSFLIFLIYFLILISIKITIKSEHDGFRRNDYEACNVIKIVHVL